MTHDPDGDLHNIFQANPELEAEAERAAIMDERPAAAKPPPPADLWRSPDQILASLAQDGEPIPTGWPPLDLRLRRGGVPPGRVIGIAGPPFAGKTTIVVHIALEVARRIPVFCLFSDEGDDQAAIRMAVMLGISLEEIDASPPTAASRMRGIIEERGLSLNLLRPDHREASAEYVAEYAAKIVPAGSPALIILDSAQTIRSRKDPNSCPESQREAIEQLVDECRTAAGRHRWIYLLTGKANRAYYRSKREDENAVAMTAWSGASVEYALDVDLVLGLADDDSGITKSVLAKNRLRHFRAAERPPGRFDLRFDEAAGSMLELDQAQVDAAASIAIVAKLGPFKLKIIELIRTSGPCKQSQILEAVPGRTTDKMAAIATLVSEKKLDRAPAGGRGGGFLYSLTAYSEAPDA